MTQPTIIRRALPAGAPAAGGMRFYLTTHKRHWVKLTDVPLFLKSEHFTAAAKLYPALGPYAVDSGGFSELQRHGTWTRTPRQYVQDLRRIWECVGPYDWAAPQDWMCEDLIIHGGTAGPNVFVGTHLSVAEHQRRTVANFLELRSLAPDLRIAPVLQGSTVPEYERCVELYERAGVNLHQEPTVGLGSVCRLQSTRQGAAIVTAIGRPRAEAARLRIQDPRSGTGRAPAGVRGLRRLELPRPQAAPAVGHPHKNCANCLGIRPALAHPRFGRHPHPAPNAAHQPERSMTHDTRTALLRAALDAAARGWHIFPLRPGTKRPALHGAKACTGSGPCTAGHRKWKQRATTDPDRIRAAWSRAPFNVGIATGPSGLVVVDLDTPEHKGSSDAPCGAATFGALCERAGHPVPTTYRVPDRERRTAPVLHRPGRRPAR
ncbi:hypothetical protein SHIRM173S_07371 [Streptomyces hirsutus]